MTTRDLQQYVTSGGATSLRTGDGGSAAQIGKKQKKSRNLPLHNGSHPKWNENARNILNRKLVKLIKRYDSIDKVPDHVLIQTVKNVEISLKKHISKWKVME